MTKREAERRTRMNDRLRAAGIAREDCDTLRRCSLTLSRWAERECGDGSNWYVERDEESGLTYNVHTETGERHRCPDRETGALKRARAIVDAAGLKLYHQTDPRGCALYVLRPGDVPEGSTPECCYTNGIAVY